MKKTVLDKQFLLPGSMDLRSILLLMLVYGAITVATGCKEKYDSPVKNVNTGYLVVDGSINSVGSSTLILSRTTSFSNKSIVYEKGAQVRMQGSDSSVLSLTEKTTGQYSIDNLNLNKNLKYRLKITTTNNQQFISDFVPVNNNSPIDSINWTRGNDGVQLFVNTHDPQNNTRYYQWYYEETWEIHSSYLSYLKYKAVSSGGRITYSVVYRDSTTFSYDRNIITCWQSNNPLYLFLGSSAKLEKDIINLPITFIPNGSIKLGVLYSIRLRQYSWTKDGYAFMEKMKSNTEATGTVFDPQPSELKGNIHNIANKDEPVLGFFNICPFQEKRIFVSNSDVPLWGYRPNCYDAEIENISDSILAKGLGFLPTTVEKTSPVNPNAILTFRAAPPECVDCTLRGTNKKPSFWP